MQADGGSRAQRATALVLAAVAVLLLAHGVHGRTVDSAGTAVGVALLARGQALGRRVQLSHALVAAAVLAAAVLQSWAGHGGFGWVNAVLAGGVLALPAPAPAPADEPSRQHLIRLVDQTPDDPLAPFALRTDKSVVFAPRATSALSYRVRFGTAVASGDPVGDPAEQAAAVRAFVRHAARHGWRVACIGTAQPQLWREHGLRAVPIGRDVVLDVATFATTGRAFRNLRQAAARARNAGIMVTVTPEAALDVAQREALIRFAARARGSRPRGFSMILDHPLDGTHPGTVVAVARDRTGRLVAVHRFGGADAGRELSLDLPWRAPDAPNGVDELIALDVLAWSRRRGGRHVSLAFAPFPELFAAPGVRRRDRAVLLAIRGLDRFINLRQLYRYLRKYHAFDRRRYVALAPGELLWVLAAALWLEFGPVPERGRRTAGVPAAFTRRASRSGIQAP